ncbi:MAG TPA: alpha/beta fold hydrolase [Steroidobacteraceae bacterium]|jgi:alpha-beta hydrolase superfamily lysophospholipase|nr:alpha/beta fold hydrolase [Steroidobacteraceae bacterium]
MSSASSNRLPIAQERSPPFQSIGAEPGGLANPIYFDSDGHRLFGWFHPPAAHTTADVGLVICKPFGYEALCSHRGLRAFAETAAALGVPALRVDYLGTGDSAEIDSQADQLEVWTRDVRAAVDELRRRTGVRHVCLLGVRLGALLAAMAASECTTAISLILIAPIVSGRRYLRELRTARLAAAVGKVQLPSAAAAPSDAADVNAGSMEVSGFWMSAATLAALKKVDLSAYKASTVSDVLVIDGRGLPGASAWAQQLIELGVRTKYLVLPGVVEMTVAWPHLATIPEAMIAAMRDWLLQFPHGPSVPSAGNGGGQYLAAAPASPIMEMTVPSNGPEGQQALLTEHPVFFGSEPVLFGIVTEPPQGEIRRRGVILLNSGADYHIGPNAMHVSFARDWARHGYVVLRMDLAGLGESGTRPGQAGHEVFPPAVLDDIRAAVAFLRTRYAAADITLFGLCSGAYHALRAAAAGIPVNRILMVNPQNYFWKEGTTLDELQPADLIQNPGLYRRQFFSAAAWKRLLSGQVDIWRIAKIYFYRPLLDVESTLRNIARRLHIRLPNDLGSELEEIHRRGVKFVFVFAVGEPGIDLLKLQAGSSVKRLGESCRIHYVDGGNHPFSQSGQRAILKKILSDELFSRS